MKPSEMVAADVAAVRNAHPMVHHITNSVVMNFTANITLCLGAAPVMAPCIDESPEMVAFAGALLLNIGTLDPPLIDSMLAAGKKANDLGIPVILDPVMISKSGYRLLNQDAQDALIRYLFPLAEVITPNIYEAQTLVNRKINNIDDMKSAALDILKLGTKKLIHAAL